LGKNPTGEAIMNEQQIDQFIIAKHVREPLRRLAENGALSINPNLKEDLECCLKGSKRSQAATVDLKVRVKEPMRAKIQREAKAKGISMNAEIVQRLQRSLDFDDLDSRLRKLESLIPETR
jgi:predicted HicB family RNase H-like nuclease